MKNVSRVQAFRFRKYLRTAYQKSEILPDLSQIFHRNPKSTSMVHLASSSLRWGSLWMSDV